MTPEELQLLKRLSKPKYTFKDFENNCIERGINPFGRHMKEDYDRCEKLISRESK